MSNETNADEDWVSVNSGTLSARINPMGAQLSVLRDHAGRDLLWDGNPAIWAGRAPLLFPIVGALNGGTYRLGTERYSLSRHGFARGSRFALTASAPDRAAFRLSSDDASRHLYPFDFDLDVLFALEGATLTIESKISNRGNVILPASLGYHPAFRWPLPFGQSRSSHYLEFDSSESAPTRRLNSEGLLAPEAFPTPIVGRRLTLVDDLFANDALIFEALRSRRVTYGAVQGPRIGVSFPDSPYLGVWTKPGANFICIEPWNGIADPQGFAEDFSRKPGIFEISPGASRSIRITITLLDGG
jgi:galactose mutarotase-like enzyme